MSTALTVEERKTYADLRREVGPPSRRDHLTQPMVSVQEVRRLLDCVERLQEPGWPACAYVYGVWEYALGRALEHSAERHQKTYLYAGTLDGAPVWVVAWDPKR